MKKAHVLTASIKGYKTAQRAAVVYQADYQHKKACQWLHILADLAFEILI